MYQLISAPPSPYARKVCVALVEKDIPFELLTDVPWDRTTSTPKYNPAREAPVLICEDGSSVYESSFILEYLELKHPAQRCCRTTLKALWPPNGSKCFATESVMPSYSCSLSACGPRVRRVSSGRRVRSARWTAVSWKSRD